VPADGHVVEVSDELETELGPAWLAIKVWARDTDDAAALVEAIAPELGFEIRGRVEIYTTEPVEPPRDVPYGYDPVFGSYVEERARLRVRVRWRPARP
jgi:hypothetical protein